MDRKHVNLLAAGAMLLCSVAAVAQESFSDCAAAFLNNRMVVNEYTTKGKCTVSGSATGVLTVNTAALTPEGGRPKDQISFRIAVRDKNTGTLVMLSGEAVKQVEIQNVLKKCSKGDHIVLMTTESRYVLPHNEILVL